MSRNILRDVIIPNRRSIRDIPITGRKRNGSTSEIKNIKTMDNRGSSKIKLWFLAIVVVVVVLVAFSTIFSGAKINLIPKQEKIEFSTHLSAIRDDIKNSSKEGVPYKILTISNEGSRTTSNFEEKDVDKKASGQITVFNNYSEESQRLIKNTRFEDPNGLIYRTPKSIVVPGRTINNGKIIPGSIVVTVYADSPGENYNIGLVDFIIPGLKGTDRFSKFYARSETSMTGGFSGVMKMVESFELEKMKKEIHTDLENELKDKIYTQVPENNILYSDGIYMTFESLPNVDLEDSVQIVEKGIINAVLFDKSELSEYIAKNTIVDIGEGEVEILNLEDLDFVINNKENIEPWLDESFEFDLKGLTHFAWVFDEDKMKESFAGQPKKNVNSILSNFVGIKEAEVIISPFWQRSFPSNVNKIEIIRTINLE